jgi:hypothetical protein
MQGGIESTIPLLADMTPLGDADALIEGAVNADPLAMALAALSFGLPGTIRPIGAKGYLPEAVQAAQKRVVEPVVGTADDAATLEISTMARTMAASALDMTPDARLARATEMGFRPETYYHGLAAPIEGEGFTLKHPYQNDAGYLGTGLYFSESPGIASSYATLKGSKVPYGEHRPNIVPVRLRYENPLHISPAKKGRSQV